MGKFNLHRGSLQLRVLTLTLLFTLGVSIVITVSNMHQLNAEWERTTLLNAEYALQTAAAAIYRDLDEVDDLASWCAYNPSMRTYLLTDSAGNNQALSMYPMISAKYNSMRTLPYIQRFMLINAAGRPMMFGTAATNVVALTPELEPELIAAKLMLLECGMVQCTAAQKGAVQLVAKDVGFISDDSGKPTEDTDTHKVRADRYVM